MSGDTCRAEGSGLSAPALASCKMVSYGSATVLVLGAAVKLGTVHGAFWISRCPSHGYHCTLSCDPVDVPVSKSVLLLLLSLATKWLCRDPIRICRFPYFLYCPCALFKALKVSREEMVQGCLE